jgi:hypothetical protein
MSVDDDATTLIKRFNEIACTLPSADSINDVRTRKSAIATAKIVLAELEKTKREIDAALGIPHRPICKSGSQ